MDKNLLAKILAFWLRRENIFYLLILKNVFTDLFVWDTKFQSGRTQIFPRLIYSLNEWLWMRPVKLCANEASFVVYMLLPVMPASCLCSSSFPSCYTSNLAYYWYAWESYTRWPKCLGSFYPGRRPEWSFWLLAWTWPSHGHYGHLWSKSAGLYLSLSNFAFQK